jgi:hypothetical protein
MNERQAVFYSSFIIPHSSFPVVADGNDARAGVSSNGLARMPRGRGRNKEGAGKLTRSFPTPMRAEGACLYCSTMPTTREPPVVSALRTHSEL